MTFTAVVPARSGSKRLPHKNIKLLGGKPLLAWTLEACVNAECIDEVILSTDSMEYWSIAKQYVSSVKLTLDYREPDEAGDTVKIFDYLKNKREKIFSGRSGAFLLTLPTVPLRSSRHIDEAVDLYKVSERAVFSATNYGFPISFAFHLDKMHEWSPVFSASPMITGNTRSQNQQEAYHPNGAIYVRSIADLADENLKTLYSGAIPYMMSRNDSVDIDCEIDFKIAEALLR